MFKFLPQNPTLLLLKMSNIKCPNCCQPSVRNIHLRFNKPTMVMKADQRVDIVWGVFGNQVDLFFRKFFTYLFFLNKLYIKNEKKKNSNFHSLRCHLPSSPLSFFSQLIEVQRLCGSSGITTYVGASLKTYFCQKKYDVHWHHRSLARRILHVNKKIFNWVQLKKL